MGCGGSKPEDSNQGGGGPRPARRQQGGNISIGPPQDVRIHVPRGRADQHGVVLQHVTRDIDRDGLVAALKHVAQYIAQRRQHISVIAVGGAVNTLYLRSRQATHDVDIFGSDFNNSARILLDEAMQSAQRAYPALGTDWINTETQLWTGNLQSQLTNAAREQNVRVFDKPGLTLYAAPWEYAFSAKANRILNGGDHARPYDLDDAVTYIHQYIQAHGNQPVPINTALGWAKLYKHNVTKNFLRDRVNRAYRSRHNTVAFV